MLPCRASIDSRVLSSSATWLDIRAPSDDTVGSNQEVFAIVESSHWVNEGEAVE